MLPVLWWLGEAAHEWSYVMVEIRIEMAVEKAAQLQELKLQKQRLRPWLEMATWNVTNYKYEYRRCEAPRILCNVICS